MASFFIILGTRLRCNIISYDYSGYGASEGKASERNMYADIEATYNSMKQRYHIPESKIILYGQSIGKNKQKKKRRILFSFQKNLLGTVPTIDLASRHSECCIACILHSPLTSGMRVAFPDTKRTWCCDAFPSIDKIHRIRSIVLIIHGTEDDVIDVSHGFALYNRIHIQQQIEPLWIDGAGHNDIEVRIICLV
jgi:pimeloyl-ACP methyl ester carboxylesterase